MFEFSSFGPEIEFECAIDAEPFESCESPYLIEELVPGDHVFFVRAIDVNLNPDPTPASYEWKVIAPPLEPTIEQTPLEPSTGNAHTFTFSYNEPDHTFECRITPNPFLQNQFEACSSPHTYSNLPDGEYLFEVRAVNSYGIAGEIPAEWEFEVANAPDTTIVAGPAADSSTSSRHVAIAFQSSEGNSFEQVFQVFLDGFDLGEIPSPFMVPDPAENVPPDCHESTEPNAAGDACVLTLGTHTITVAAVDIDGNVDLTPASRTWTVVEGSPPETTIGNGPDSSTTSTSATFNFSANEPSTFHCRLDSGPIGACVSPVTYDGLALGPHQFTVTATDGDGVADESPATYVWTIAEPDSTPPDTSLGQRPAAITNGTAATFSFSAEAGATFECSLDGGAYCRRAARRSHTPASSAGPHTFAVLATDASDNIETEPATHAWTVDLADPDTSITSHPADPSSSTFETFGISGSDDVSALADLRYQCRLDDAPWVSCLNPKSYTNLVAGPHTFYVRAVDQAGNVDETPAEYSWTVDPVAPETTISVAPPTIAISVNATFQLASEPGVDFECSLDNEPFVSCESPVEYTDLAAGDHTFAARAIDAAGNVDASPATHAWTIDLAPDTTIDTYPLATTASPNASFTFSSNEPGASFECSLDNASYSSCVSPRDYTGLAASEHTLRVRAIDSVGSVDQTPASYTWTITPPPDTILGPVTPDMGVDLQTESRSVTFTFSSDQPGATFKCGLDTDILTVCTSPAHL